MIWWGRRVIRSNPHNEAICEYLAKRNLIGQLVIPKDSVVDNQDKFWAAQYEYYLRRGLPIPSQFMPKDEQGRRKSEDILDAPSFDPSIKMDFGSETRIPPKANRDDDRMQRRCILGHTPRLIQATFLVSEEPTSKKNPKKKTWAEWITGR